MTPRYNNYFITTANTIEHLLWPDTILSISNVSTYLIFHSNSMIILVLLIGKLKSREVKQFVQIVNGGDEIQTQAE